MKSTAFLPLTWLQKLLCLLGFGVFFAVVYVLNGLFQHSEVDAQLQQSLHEVDARSPGWQFAALEAARATIPDDENSAFDVARAAKYMPPEYADFAIYQMLGSTIYQKTGFYARTPIPLTWYDRLAVQAELELRVEALAEAQRLVDKPHGRFPLLLNDKPWTTPLPHLAQVAFVVHLLTLNAQYHADLGDSEEAARSCRVALQAVRSLGDEPFPYSQDVRSSQAVVAARGVQYLLNRGVSEPDTLADLQRRLEEEAEHPACFIAMRGNRAITHAKLQAVESGKVSWKQLVSEPQSEVLFWHSTPSLDEIRRQHAILLPFQEYLIQVAQKPPPLRGQLLNDEFKSQIEEGAFPVLEALVRDLPNLEQRLTAREAKLLCTAVAVALERYRCQHHRWPASLDELTPTFLKQTPLDPANGEPLTYERLGDSVVISSRCFDDYGNPYRANNGSGRRRVAVRLWDVPLRGTTNPFLLLFPPEDPRRGRGGSN